LREEEGKDPATYQRIKREEYRGLYSVDIHRTMHRIGNFYVGSYIYGGYIGLYLSEEKTSVAF